MNSKDMTISQQFLSMATAKMVTKPMYVAAKLNIADHIEQGSNSIGALAKKTNAHESSLYRLMRALCSVGIFKERENKEFELTPLAECLLDKPGSQRGMLMWFNDPIHDQAWEYLQYSVESGKPAFNKKFDKPIFDYFQNNKEISEVFNTAMTSNVKGVHGLIANAIDLSGAKCLYDIGGGHGHLVAQIMEKNDHLKCGVFDIPHVVAGASGKGEIAFEIFGGDFFEEIPAGADAHIMTFILHDWDDNSCLKILENSHKALEPGGKLYIGSNIIGAINEPSLGKLLDIEMLVMTTGQERTESEFKTLFERAGFTYQGAIDTKGPVSLLVASK